MLGWKPSVTSAAPSMALPSRTFAAVAPRQGCGAADSCLTVTVVWSSRLGLTWSNRPCSVSHPRHERPLPTPRGARGRGSALPARVGLCHLETESLQGGDEGTQPLGGVKLLLVVGDLVGAQVAGPSPPPDLARPGPIRSVGHRWLATALASRPPAGGPTLEEGPWKCHPETTAMSLATRRTVRTNLRAIARAHACGPPPVWLGRERAKAPYSKAEIASYLSLADAQPTESRRMRASALVCLSAGAGLMAHREFD